MLHSIISGAAWPGQRAHAGTGDRASQAEAGVGRVRGGIEGGGLGLTLPGRAFGIEEDIRRQASIVCITRRLSGASNPESSAT